MLYFKCLVCIVVSWYVYIVVDVLRYCYHLVCICCTLCIAVFILDAELLTRSLYSEGPATGHLDKCFSWFLCVIKQMLRWFPRFEFAGKCFSCSPTDLNLLVTNFIFCIHVKNHWDRVTTQLQLIKIIESNSILPSTNGYSKISFPLSVFISKGTYKYLVLYALANYSL